MHVRKCNKDFNNHRKSKVEGVQSEMNKKTCFRKSERNVLMQNSSFKMFPKKLERKEFVFTMK